MFDGPGTPEISVATATRTLEQASKVREAANNISVNVEVPALVIPAEQKTMPEEKKEPISTVSETPVPTSTPEQRVIEAREMAAKFGKVISKGDPMDLKARELRDAWDRATYSGIGKVEESSDLLARMEKDNQLTRSDKTGGEAKPAGSAAPAPAASENPATVSPVSPVEQKPSGPVTPESPTVPAAPPVEAPPATTSGEVPLNPVKTAEQKQAEQAAEREAKMKAYADAKAGPENEVKDQLSQAEEELKAKIKAARGPGGEALTGGEERTIARDFWMAKLGEQSLMYAIQHQPGLRGEIGRFFAFVSGGKERVGIVKKNEQGLMEAITKDGKPLEFDINHMLQHPGQDLVDYLKGEYSNKIRGKTEEVTSPTEDTAPAKAPETPDQPGPTVQPAEKPSAEEAKSVKEVTANEVKDPKEQYEEYLADLGYVAEAGESVYDFQKLRNEKGEYITDKTGKPFEFKFYSEANEFLKSEVEKKQAETVSPEAKASETTPEGKIKLAEKAYENANKSWDEIRQIYNKTLNENESFKTTNKNFEEASAALNKANMESPLPSEEAFKQTQLGKDLSDKVDLAWKARVASEEAFKATPLGKEIVDKEKPLWKVRDEAEKALKQAKASSV